MMSLFDWITTIIVAASLIYLVFVLTIREWFIALRQRQAVNLLPERSVRANLLVMLLALAIFVPFFIFGWIPLFLLPAGAARILDVIGLALYLSGMSFLLWARHTLGKMWGLTTAGQVKLRNDHRLIQSGPYAFVRHPLYFGAWVFLFGLVLLYPVWVMLILFLATLVSYSARARLEETALADRFGAEWTAYRQRTKFLIPFIY
jgi:protein-S-isoprenylcysteine O-methyltransferase Ste14